MKQSSSSSWSSRQSQQKPVPTISGRRQEAAAATSNSRLVVGFVVVCLCASALLVEASNGQPGQSGPHQQRGLDALASTQLAAVRSQSPAASASIESPKVQSGARDMHAAAGHHYGKSHGHGYGKYYMYAESPKKGAYKAGFKRGNHKHTIERKESQHKSHASGYMKWHAKKGKGSHKWDYKHHGKKYKGHHY